MPTKTANGQTATRIAGVPNTWLVRHFDTLYYAITTDGRDISEIDAGALLLPGDHSWNAVGTVHRTSADDYDTRDEGSHMAGWHVEVNHNATGPYPTIREALSQLKLVLRDRHARLTNRSTR